MGKKIGIMGGTFDPIHMGHLILAENAYHQFQLDEVMFLPAGNPPHKRNREGRATKEQRTEMVRLAIQGNDHFTLCLDEMYAEGLSYTYLTLERLQRENPEHTYYFIIGADSLFQFETWREPARICKAATLLVAERDAKGRKLLLEQISLLENKYHGRFELMDTTNVEISSQMLRERIMKSESTRYYIPDSVYEYIQKQKIYL